MRRLIEKVYLSKVVIESLLEAKKNDEDLSYEDMMAAVESTPMPEGCQPLSEESMITHAQFIVAQVFSTQIIPNVNVRAGVSAPK